MAELQGKPTGLYVDGINVVHGPTSLVSPESSFAMRKPQFHPDLLDYNLYFHKVPREPSTQSSFYNHRSLSYLVPSLSKNNPLRKSVCAPKMYQDVIIFFRLCEEGRSLGP